MSLSINQVLTAIGIARARERTMVVEYLMSNLGKINYLLDETIDDVEDTILSNTKLVAADKFTLGRVIVKRLISLMYWAKDWNKLDKRIEFDSDTGMVVILVLLQETTSRENPRRDKNKIDKSLIFITITTKLKYRPQ